MPGLGVAAALAFSLLIQLQGASLTGSNAVTALLIAADGSAQCRFRKAGWHPVHIERQAYASAWLIVLRVAGTWQTPRRVVLFADSADADALRRLRTWLHWGRDQHALGTALPGQDNHATD